MPRWPWKTLEERFWSNVRKDGPIQPHCPELGPCWRYVGKRHWEGYGYIAEKQGGKKYLLVHRVSWVIHNGPIPDGLFVLHKCDNGECSRPDHLFLGTQAENNRDRKKKGRNGDIRGARGPNVKLTERQVLEIRSMRARSVTISTVAKHFNICISTVKRIMNGRIWSHLQGEKTCQD